jgi:hypothetical protein
MDWREILVEDLVREINLFLGDDRGWNSSLVKRDF